MPFDDWQFYVVTLVALWGLWALLRPFLPRDRKAEPGCPTCASGSAAGRKKRAPLTIHGKKP